MRELMNNILRENIKESNSIALLFSGGTDSLSCLFSLLDIGIKPTLYTFHLENTKHRDVEVSEKVASHFNLKHVIVIIPEDIRQLKSDVLYLTQEMKLTRKTNVQCTYPFLHVLPIVTEDYVVSGLCADDLMGTSKSMSMKYSKDVEGFNVARLKIFENEYSSAYKPIKDLVISYDKMPVFPYRDQRMIDFYMTKSWEDINKPKQKQITVNNYKELFDELNVYRRNVNLQVGSKIREWHNVLIETDLNKNNRRRVDEIYKDLAKYIK